MLPSAVQNSLVENLGSLPALLEASREDLDRVYGVGARRAAAIHTALHRMQQRVVR